MQKIGIVTDTNSGMSAQEAREAGVALLPMPFTGSVTARYTRVRISSASSGFSSKIRDRERSAEFTSKYGFSVVAPMRMMVPSSTKGRR